MALNNIFKINTAGGGGGSGGSGGCPTQYTVSIIPLRNKPPANSTLFYNQVRFKLLQQINLNTCIIILNINIGTFNYYN